VASAVSVARAEELARIALTPPMRGLVEGLSTPRPIGDELPAALQEDDFCMRMVGALDEVLAPLFTTLDCWDSYLDPQLAPDDFVDWVASWVGVDIDETWTLDRRRRLIQDAVVLYRIRGTAAGLAAHVNLYTGITPLIEESGGCAWSQTADAPIPGSAQPHLTVRLRVDDAAIVNKTTVNRIVGASRPAHLPFEVEIVSEGTTPRPGAMSPEPDVRGPDGTEPGSAGGGGVARDAPGAVDLPGSERIELAPQSPTSQEELDDQDDSSPDENESKS